MLPFFQLSWSASCISVGQEALWEECVLNSKSKKFSRDPQETVFDLIGLGASLLPD